MRERLKGRTADLMMETSWDQLISLLVIPSSSLKAVYFFLPSLLVRGGLSKISHRSHFWSSFIPHDFWNIFRRAPESAQQPVWGTCFCPLWLPFRAPEHDWMLSWQRRRQVVRQAWGGQLWGLAAVQQELQNIFNRYRLQRSAKRFVLGCETSPLRLEVSHAT